MDISFCGIDCTKCRLKGSCIGCVPSGGRPFHGGQCPVAACCQSKGHTDCSPCRGSCKLKDGLIAEFNALGLEGMEKVTGLNVLPGSYINLEYTLPNGQAVKLLEDNKIYFGNQLCKKGSDRCYGLAADENYLLVCEYGSNGSDAEIVVYQKRSKGASD